MSRRQAGLTMEHLLAMRALQKRRQFFFESPGPEKPLLWLCGAPCVCKLWVQDWKEIVKASQWEGKRNSLQWNLVNMYFLGTRKKYVLSSIMNKANPRSRAAHKCAYTCRPRALLSFYWKKSDITCALAFNWNLTSNSGTSAKTTIWDISA